MSPRISAAVTAMIAAIEGTGKPFINCSGTMMVQNAKPATENDTAASPDGPRVHRRMPC